MNWIGFAAGGTLVAGGLLLLAGERRAGLVAAAAGTTLALLEEKDTLHSWWEALPGYIDQVQRVIGQVQDAVNEVAEKRETLRRALAR
jgi:ABC-type transporter Mla subunit MlaD